MLAEQFGQWRLPQRELQPAAGRAVVDDLLDLPTEQTLRGRRGVADGRGREDEHGLAAVASRDALQPTKNLSDVGTEDTAIAVTLVDHDEAQPLPER